MAELEKVIKAIEVHISTDDSVGCDDCTYENDGWCMTRVLADALELLKKSSSTLGITQTATSLIFTATGDAKQGEERGVLLGKAVMYETISQALVRRGLMTKEIREVIKGISIR